MRHFVHGVKGYTGICSEFQQKVKILLVAPDSRPDKTGPTIRLYVVDSSSRSTQNLFKNQ